MMKRLLFFLFIGIQQLPALQTHILFLGNSYTYTNNMPDLLKQLALSGGDSITWDSNTPGGYTFQNHTQDANSISKINSYPWDFVILQGQSQEPSVDTAYVVANVFPYAHQLDSLVYKNDSCSQTIFFMTWGRKNGDTQNCVAYPPVCTFLGMEQQLENRYLQMGNDNGAIVGPVGEAWKNAIATNPAFDLYMSDESHPSLYGSYLTACVFYATIYKQSPLGLNYYGGLPTADATFLQSIAGATVLDSMQLWNTNVYEPNSNFSAAATGINQITCAATGNGNNFWQWDDGTGNGFVNGTATEVFNYTQSGTYTICLAVSNGCLTDTFCQQVSTTTGINSPAQNYLSISPNPSSGNVTLNFSSSLKKDGEIKIYDSKGNLIRDEFVSASSTSINLENLPEGILLITFLSEKDYSAKRIVITEK
jgi:hypothetical protein